MPPVEDIQRQMQGAWRMMTGRHDGIRLLDLSVDGFWNSFFAILVALPVMLMAWVPVAGDLAGPGASFAVRLGIVIRLALVDIGAWILPLVALAAVVDYVGLRDRFVHYIVASNWASALFAWFMLPASLVRLFMPEAADAATAFALGIFLASLVLSWRLTDAALGKGAATTTAVFFGILFASILTLFALQDILRLNPE